MSAGIAEIAFLIRVFRSSSHLLAAKKKLPDYTEYFQILKRCILICLTEHHAVREYGERGCSSTHS
jgi:hypothetical protein